MNTDKKVAAALQAAAQKFMSARAGLVLDIRLCFFGSLALRLKVRADETCKTAWVDGVTLGYNPTFINSLTTLETISLVAHEVMHCALSHPHRRNGRDSRKWNIACDKAINTILRDSGFKLPDNGYYAEGEEIGKSAEWIYARMQQEQEPEPDEPEPGEDESEDGGDGEDGDEDNSEDGDSEGQPGDSGDSDGDSEDGDSEGQPGDSSDSDGDGNGTGNGQGEPDPLGEVRDAPTGPDADGNEPPTEQEWKEYAASAAQHAKMMGHLPGGMARAIAQALKPKTDVRSLLLRFFQERSASDYTWTRPNVRYLSRGLYLPALHDHSLGEVAIMVDTSGSMDDVALARARGIVESVIDECNPARVSMYYADADVKHVDHFEQGEPLEWPGKDVNIGGGGTDFRPALEAIERDETPLCVICITDLYGAFPEIPPSIPVLWLSTSEYKTAPFGETVYVDE